MFNKIKNFFNRVGKAIENKCNEIYRGRCGACQGGSFEPVGQNGEK